MPKSRAITASRGEDHVMVAAKVQNQPIPTGDKRFSRTFWGSRSTAMGAANALRAPTTNARGNAHRGLTVRRMTENAIVDGTAICRPMLEAENHKGPFVGGSFRVQRD
jgi:hypothetical protein